MKNRTWVKTGLLVAACGLGAAAPAAPALLLPLSDADTNRISESGCNFGFDTTSRNTLVFAINRNTLIRTGPGAKGVIQCQIAEAPFDAFTQGNGSATCGATRLTLRQTGKGKAHPEADSATFPATLTVERGGKSWMTKGEAGTAC